MGAVSQSSIPTTFALAGGVHQTPEQNLRAAQLSDARLDEAILAGRSRADHRGQAW
jgi:hypothetical protein